MFHYYDPLPKTDDVTATVAVNECQNCGKACETLVWLEGWNYNACDTCAEEAAREDAREAAERQKPCVNCKTRLSRWDSLYCSDRCKSAFLYFPEVA
ncbi:MAG TPA: hypothetical protein VKB88_21455 [Bryobacteraceae bacterium]|nr:hypothetical protein [Bryobacteraceae bacterium]